MLLQGSPQGCMVVEQESYVGGRGATDFFIYDEGDGNGRPRALVASGTMVRGFGSNSGMSTGFLKRHTPETWARDHQRVLLNASSINGGES